jgi:hypothetical protein
MRTTCFGTGLEFYSRGKELNALSFSIPSYTGRTPTRGEGYREVIENIEVNRFSECVIRNVIRKRLPEFRPKKAFTRIPRQVYPVVGGSDRSHQIPRERRPHA